MLDYNHRPTFQESVVALIDQALQRERAATPTRDYLGASRLGAVCERALQYEYVQAPVDSGRELDGRVLRVFEVGHALEALVIRWLQLAGFEVATRRPEGGQFGFSAAGGRLRGHVDGIITAGPASLGLDYPMLFECKTMKAKLWKQCAKQGVAVSHPAYHSQIVVYQAYMETTVQNISQNPCLFVAINKDTQELYLELVPFDAALAQASSDRAVRLLVATEHGEQLPRPFSDPTHYECRLCAWQDRCWRPA